MVDPEMIPNADQHLRDYQALQPPRNVYGDGSHELLVTGTAKLTKGAENTAGEQRETNMSVMLVHGLGRNMPSSLAALANGVETTISAFPAMRAKGGNVPLRADQNVYCLDAILLELPSEYVNVGETFRVMWWNRRYGHINAPNNKKLTQEKGTGVVVKDTDFSVSNCYTCAAKSKQPNHPKVVLVEVT